MLGQHLVRSLEKLRVSLLGRHPGQSVSEQSREPCRGRMHAAHSGRVTVRPLPLSLVCSEARCVSGR